MLEVLLKIAKQCDRRNEWTEQQWIDTLLNCIDKDQYILIQEGNEIIAFSCWLFIKDFEKIGNQYIEDVNGKIAYIQCAYVKKGHRGLLYRMLREGVERHPDAECIFYCSDKLNNKKIIIPVNKWRNKCLVC
uniref:N-acetyltransferase domain-containing protein n=1 Tax=viral metagenome TaxID=1070528 RepID=A0A6M3KL51_9ZZZZ